jgi:murein DD-endopeptidase MepM/ murein hydrolase activator NlpD
MDFNQPHRPSTDALEVLRRLEISLIKGLTLSKLGFLLLLFLTIPLAVAYAGFFSSVADIFIRDVYRPVKSINSQNVALLQSALSPDGESARGGADVPVVGGTALFAEAGPAGALSDVDTVSPGTESISIYEVRPGDTLSSIALMFGISVNTIRWANDIPIGTPLRVGQSLVILPVSGVSHTVKKGDTIASIAKKYKGDPDEIRAFNGLSGDAELAVGDTIIVPDGEIAPVVSAPSTRPATSKLRGTDGPSISGYYIAPLANYRKTQGIHGYNGVDLASYFGAPVFAAADGDVIVAREGGYNGGYGSYIVIRHDNGTQTLYGHLSSVKVSAGMRVSQGFTIGTMGNSGRSTGPHLHFEVRGAKNPF